MTNHNNHGFIKPTLIILFVVILLTLFSLLRSIIQTVNNGEEMKQMQVTDTNKDTQ